MVVRARAEMTLKVDIRAAPSERVETREQMGSRASERKKGRRQKESIATRAGTIRTPRSG